MRTETAVCPSDGTPFPFERPGLGMLGRSLRRRRGRLLLLGCWSALEAAPALLSGLLVSKAIDDGFLNGAFGAGVAFLLGLLIAHGVGAIATRFTYPLVGSIVEPLRDELLGGIVDGIVRSRGTRYFSPDSAAISRITQQVETVRRTCASLLTGLRRFVFTMAATAIGLGALAVEILWIALPPILLSAALFGLLLGTLVRRQRAAILANERVAREMGDAVSGSRDITAFRRQDGIVGKLEEVLGQERSAQQALAGATAIRGVITALGTHLPLLGVLIATPWLLDQGVSVGMLVGAATYLSTNVEPAMRLLTEVVGGSGLQLAVTLQRLSDTGEEPDPEGSPEPCPSPADASVRLASVDFAYGAGSDPVISALDLEVGHGLHLAVVGPSGIGKSTLGALIAGLVPPDRGRVLIGGVPSVDLMTSRRRTVALIPQEAYVFTGTVRDNLAYLHADADDARLASAASAVGADALLARLGGLDGEVAPSSLSRGEAQLLALARAYAAEAEVTVLDEATCHLDLAAEAVAEEAFRRRPGTLIVIAHRVGSAMRADRVLLLDGTAATCATHEELLRSSALYRDMVGGWEPDGSYLPPPHEADRGDQA